MKKVLVLILASASISLFAMDVPGQQEKYLNDRLWHAVSKGSLNEIQQLISAGASLNPDKYANNPLFTAIVSSQLQHRRLEVLKLLLDNGARADSLATGYNCTPLMIAAESGTPEEVLLLLAAIPLDEHEYIKNSFPFFSKKMRSTGFISKDPHGLVQEQVIAQLVQRQMQRIALLLEMRKFGGQTARDLGLQNITNNQEAISTMLDLNNPASYAQIRATVEQNVRRILFAPQQNANH